MNKKNIFLIAGIVVVAACILPVVSNNAISKDKVRIISDRINQSENCEISFELKKYHETIVYAAPEWKNGNTVRVQLYGGKRNGATPITRKNNRFLFTLPWPQKEKTVSMNFNGHNLGSWTKMN